VNGCAAAQLQQWVSKMPAPDFATLVRDALEALRYYSPGIVSVCQAMRFIEWSKGYMPGSTDIQTAFEHLCTTGVAVKHAVGWQISNAATPSGI
jgi:hypothetical protein